MNTEKLSNEAENPALNKGAVIQCSVLIPKLIGDWWEDVQCKNAAKFKLKYKSSKNREVITTKKCCTIHRNKLVKEIEKDSFAELVSVENIA